MPGNHARTMAVTLQRRCDSLGNGLKVDPETARFEPAKGLGDDIEAILVDARIAIAPGVVLLGVARQTIDDDGALTPDDTTFTSPFGGRSL